jgi:hypothetical protein
VLASPPALSTRPQDGPLWLALASLAVAKTLAHK